jgi:hypothetical protein
MSRHIRPGSNRTFWVDLAALIVLVGGLNLVIWGGFVTGWVLVAVAGAKLSLTLVNRRRIQRRDSS